MFEHGLESLQELRRGAGPALLMVPLLPLFFLLPARWSRGFFLVSGLALLTLVSGVPFTLLLLGAVLATYATTERVAAMSAGVARKSAFILLLVLLHVAYWAIFQVSPPPTFASMELRPADVAGVFLLFSGAALTFFRLVSFVHDRVRRGQPRASLSAFLAYLFFFPQFLHGPLERCDWLSAQLKAKKAVRDVSTQVLVKGIKQWAAYEQKSGAKKVRTVFKIT